MSLSERSPNPAKNGQSREPVRKSVLLVALMAVAVSTLGVVMYFRSHRPASPAGSAELQTNLPANQEEPVLVQIPSNTSGSITAPAPPTPTPVAVAFPPKPAEIKPARPEPSAYTRQLVKSLTDLDLKQGPLTAEKAAEWQQNLQALLQQGAAAVPALEEFFERNTDLRFDSGSGTNFLGEQSLRLALLKSLPNISGAEALELQARVLQSTADPQEIALLARQLEQQVPEQYRQMSIDAARAALEMAAAGKLPGRDVGPLFGVLQQFGDASVVGDFQQSMSHWRYYGAIALANMPDGAGIPALVEMAQGTTPDGTPRGARNIAMQMLAQVAAQSDLARSVLLEQAKAENVANSTWIEIGSILSGNPIQIGNLGSQGILPVSGERRWSLAQGQQNFYSRPAYADWSADDYNKRIAIIDELLVGTANPLAQDSLQRARSTLQSRLARQ